MATLSNIALTLEFPLRVVLYPAPDVSGQWIAHGLETDVVTQGDSVEHALAMMADALDTLARHQAGQRRPLLRLRPAPVAPSVSLRGWSIRAYDARFPLP